MAMSDAQARSLIAEAARTHAFDLYLCALLAPRDMRADLLALAAFEGEVGRIPQLVSEPLLGEIRLQWWRDAIAERSAKGAATGNPVADALVDVVRRRGLDVAGLLASLDARQSEMGDDGPAGMTGLVAHADAVDGAAFRRAYRVLAPHQQEPGDAELLQHAGRAVGLTRLLRAPPSSLRHGAGRTSPGFEAIAVEARAHLAEARRARKAASRPARTASLPVALVEPYLQGLQRVGYDEQMSRVDVISPLTRVWRLWWAARTGRW